MNKLIAVLLAGLFCVSVAHAQDKKAAEKAAPAAKAAEKSAPAAEKKRTPQQERMAACNKDAAEKKMAGDDRKKFMSACLSGKPAPESKAKTPQQEKMAKCNVQAKEKKVAGADRKKFMSECLKG